jgi:Tfp pilus assembly protein PilN
MIEINLLPGQTPKKGGRGGAGVDLGGAAAAIGASVKDPWLIGAVASVLLAGLIVAGLFWYQRGVASKYDEQLRLALQDSTRYTGVIKEKRRAEAERDSVVRQVELIKSFDNKRFVWPHIMDEISRALPPYTWITSVVQTNMGGSGAVQAQQQPATPPKPGDKVVTHLPTVDSTTVPRVRLRIVGNTVDIQALTRFMKDLEASPFLTNVQLDRSELALEMNKEVTQFQLTIAYNRPDTSVVRRAPLTLSAK